MKAREITRYVRFVGAMMLAFAMVLGMVPLKALATEVEVAQPEAEDVQALDTQADGFQDDVVVEDVAPEEVLVTQSEPQGDSVVNRDEALLADGIIDGSAVSENSGDNTQPIDGTRMADALESQMRTQAGSPVDYWSFSCTADYAKAKSVLDIVNSRRASAGRSALRMNASLQSAAMQRAAEIAMYFDHTRPDESSCFTVSDMASGENIAAGQQTASAVMSAWMNSSGHKANILEPSFSSIGVGCCVVGGITYWVQLFSYQSSSSNTFAGSGSRSQSFTVAVSYGSPTVDNIYIYNTDGKTSLYTQSPNVLTRGKNFCIGFCVKDSQLNTQFRVSPHDFSWSSSNTGVARVSQTGVVTAGPEVGTADVFATSSRSGVVLKIPFKTTPPNVSYRTHVQRIGWQKYVSNGAMSGTSGKSYRLEGINIKLSNLPYSGGIQYRTHVQRIGWQGWKKNGAMAGTSGKSYRLEAIEIKLYGEMAKQYDVYYRVHCQKFGWMGWAKNGQRSGSEGYGRRLEGIQIVLVKKGAAAPGNTYLGIKRNIWRAYVKRGK